MSGALGVAVVTLGFLAGGALGGAESASAHDYLVSTNPAADSTVTEALSEVSLTFNEPPLADSSAAIAIELHDPSGANVAHGAVSIVNSTLSIDVAPTTQGAYTVLWQNVSADGHAVSGQFGFQYAGPVAGGGAGGGSGAAGTPGAGGPAVSTPGVGANDEGGASATPMSTATSTSTSTPAVPGAAGPDGLPFPLVLVGVLSAAGVVAIVAIILVVMLRRRSRP